MQFAPFHAAKKFPTFELHLCRLEINQTTRFHIYEACSETIETHAF